MVTKYEVIILTSKGWMYKIFDCAKKGQTFVKRRRVSDMFPVKPF